MQKSIEQLTKKAKDYLNNALNKMQGIRVQMIANLYEKNVMSILYNRLSNALIPEKNKLYLYNKELNNNRNINQKYYAEIDKLQNDLQKVPYINLNKKNKIKNKISDLQKDINMNNRILMNIQNKYDIHSNNDFIKIQTEINNRQKQYDKLSSEINKINQDNTNLINDYKNVYYDIKDEYVINLDGNDINKYEEITRKKLQNKYKNDYNEDEFTNAKNIVDRQIKNISGDNIIKKNKTLKIARH